MIVSVSGHVDVSDASKGAVTWTPYDVAYKQNHSAVLEIIRQDRRRRAAAAARSRDAWRAACVATLLAIARAQEGALMWLPKGDESKERSRSCLTEEASECSSREAPPGRRRETREFAPRVDLWNLETRYT